MRYILEQMPYRSQRDNSIAPSSSCGPTAHSNALAAVGLQLPHGGLEHGADFLTEQLESPQAYQKMLKIFPWAKGRLKPRNFSFLNAWAVNRIMSPIVGADVVYHGYRSYINIVQAILKDMPVVISADFTSFGHFVTVVGFECTDFIESFDKIKERDITALIVDDSWGNYNTNYKDKNGDNVIYKISMLKPLMASRNYGQGLYLTNLILNPSKGINYYVR